MSPAVLSLSVAASAVLLVASVAARQRLRPAFESQDPDDAPDLADELQVLAAQAVNAIAGSPAADMTPSAELLAMLKQGEQLRLQRYRLGDGGWTIGYGRYYPDSGPTPPQSIDRDTAEAWFADDVETRAARWVRAYVGAPLLQHQFDALVHMAYNLSPKAFRTIADAINAGDDPEAAALQFVRAGTHLERGLRNRRAREIALWREGTYA